MSDRTRVMGILNVTPDSFSDGGLVPTVDAAIARGFELVAQGADIVDVGGESTRPGATPVHPEEEQRRVIDVVRELVAGGVQVSVDTMHASTTAVVARSGVHFINDVSGGTYDPEMLTAVAESSATYIISHWRGVPDPRQQRSSYADVVTEVRDALRARTDEALAAGIDRGRIVIDPGLGFDKTGNQCWTLLARLDVLNALGYPVLIGASRKRMLVDVMQRLDERLPARRSHGTDAPRTAADRDLMTAVVSALAARSGVWGVRVHDVPATVEALAITEAWNVAWREHQA
ncbi:MAG: dihydropteroate synthase [Leucobacter sp.]